MYYLYKLNFPNGVHFGADKSGVGLEKIAMTCHSDTLYSALCLEILNLYGEDKLREFVELTQRGDFLISDLMPYKADDLYLPKPTIYIEKNSENETASDSTIKKKMKKLNYIPLKDLSNYLKFIKNGGNFPNYDTDFGTTATYEKVQLSREENNDEHKLYSVGAYYFKENCGLYFIVKLDETKKDWFDKVILSLSYSGLGGKRNVGYGRFEIETSKEISAEATKELYELLEAEGDYYMTLSMTHPQADEIDEVKNGFYTLTRRQGFIYSKTYAKNFLKKVPTVMLNIGSCLKTKLKGEVVDVSNNGNHAVYRYGKPIMIGINL